MDTWPGGVMRPGGARDTRNSTLPQLSPVTNGGLLPLDLDWLIGLILAPEGLERGSGADGELLL